MHCLNDCENAVLDFFFGIGDRTTTLYQCAEDLYLKFPNIEVIAACSVLEDLGLLKSAGDSTKYFALSPAAVGDVGNGYFRNSGGTSEEMLAMETQLVEIRKAQEDIQRTASAAARARPDGAGGLAGKDKK